MIDTEVKEEKSDGPLGNDISTDSEETEVNDCEEVNDREEVNCDENYQDKSITDDNDGKNEEIVVHLLDEISVYMTTPSGDAPYLCPDCDYKTTIDVIYDDHRQSHTDYAAADCSDW